MTSALNYWLPSARGVWMTRFIAMSLVLFLLSLIAGAPVLFAQESVPPSIFSLTPPTTQQIAEQRASQAKEEAEWRRQSVEMSKPRPDIYAMRSDPLSKALSHPETLLQFITSPDTNYADRRAAAVQGAASIPLDQMPLILSETDELDSQGSYTGWGCSAHPRDSNPGRFGFDTGPFTLTVLGHLWKSPATRLPYPLSWEEESKAPWPWQVQHALDDLLGGMVENSGKGDPTRQRWFDVAMKMPCTNDAEAHRFVEATTFFRRVATLAVTSRWREIAANPAMPDAATSLVKGICNFVPGGNDDRAAQDAIQLVILAFHQPGKAKFLMNCNLPAMREFARTYDRPFTTERLPLPATTTLRFCELAMDPASGDDYTRLYCFVAQIYGTVDDPPFLPNLNNLDPTSPDIQKYLNQFSDWFASRRLSLESAAKTEAPILDRLRIESDKAARELETAAH